MLVSNKNLLIIADILTVNKGFADANPKMVKGIVHGLLGRQPPPARQPDQNLGVARQGRSNGPMPTTKDELAHVHLSNLPENLAFFKGTIDARRVRSRASISPRCWPMATGSRTRSMATVCRYQPSRSR
jgi:NitT/TauT family transport system substrate-binding protein